MDITTQYTQRSPYVHCASICPFEDGVLISYYVGPECNDLQHARLEYWVKDKLRSSYELHPKTGNCVVYPLDSSVMMIYSHFNDFDGVRYPETPVERWAYCSNWMSRVTLDGELRLSEPIPLVTYPLIGYLTRCTPIQVNEVRILPIYHEIPGYGAIMKSSNGFEWRMAGSIGLRENKCIQPTIWYDGKVLHSLSRNVDKNHKCAWYSSSRDMGETWSKLVQTPIDNTSNSLVVVNGDPNPLIIWNKGAGRSILMLGRLDVRRMAIEPCQKLNKQGNGSYPNYCVDKDKKLHIVHTDGNAIAHHVITNYQ